MIESIFEKLLNKELPSDTEILYLLDEYYKKYPSKHKLEWSMPTPVIPDPIVNGDYSWHLRDYFSPIRFG